MNGRLGIYLDQAWQQVRDGLRGPLVPLSCVGLAGYLLLILGNAEYLRDMGATDAPLNSAHLVQLMTSGQALMVIFAWAWVFGQVVARDRRANLHEIVLAAPVSLRGLIFARFCGALVLACVLVVAMPLTFLVVPALAKLGIFPTDTVGPAPLAAIAWSCLWFGLLPAIGCGSLFVAAALRTRSTAGPFAVAAFLAVVWMVAMIVLRSAGMDGPLAVVLDPTCYGEIEAQSQRWTPAEKATELMAITPAVAVNRLIWVAAPVLGLVVALVRVKRETLALEREGGLASDERSGAVELRPEVEVEALPPVVSMSSARMLLDEARWQLRMALRGWGLRLTLGLFVIVGTAGAFVHIVGHAEGPMVARPQLLALMLAEFTYLMVVFMVAGFVGVLARRDERQGFGEMLDATPAPFGVRVLGRVLAAMGITLILSLTPAVSAWVVMALTGNISRWHDPLLFDLLLVAPAMFELCALVLLSHALLRSAGAAYALSMLFAFIAVVNHEAGVVAYPPAQVGIPVHVALSELTGWAPWLVRVFVGSGFKLALVALICSLAWLIWPRGLLEDLASRGRASLARLSQGPARLAAVSVLLLVPLGWVQHHKLAVVGEFESPGQERAGDAAWEQRWWSEASEVAVEGGEVELTVDPRQRRVELRWLIDGLRTGDGRLHAALPHGLSVSAARVDGEAVEFTVGETHLAVELGGCAARACTLEFELLIELRDWPAEEIPPWLHRSGMWARASDLLPRLGHDPERLLRSPEHREDFGLAELPPVPGAQALSPVAAVAPAGRWRWSATASRDGAWLRESGSVEGPLDFALVWRPRAPEELSGEARVWHGRSRADTAAEVLADYEQMVACVGEHWGFAPQIEDIIQAPRELGEIAVHGSTLWLPEHEGWDIAAEGFGRWQRRAELATALVARALADRADLREEPGARWLVEGVAGWAGLACVHERDGHEAWVALLDRRTDRVVEALGGLDAPIVGLADDGAADWVSAYGPWATQSWAARAGADEVRRVAVAVADAVAGGRSLRDALVDEVGPALAELLLGPPWSSDLSVQPGAQDQLAVAAQRWRWQGGGWQAQRPPEQVMRVSSDGAVAEELPLAPAPEQASDGGFVVLDGWPSFERSLVDNVWGATTED